MRKVRVHPRFWICLALGALLLADAAAPSWSMDASAADCSRDTAQLEANKALVVRLFRDGFSGGNLSVVEEIFSPDIKLVDPNLPPGIEGVKAIVKKNNDTFDGWSFTLHDVLAIDDKVVVRWTGSGVHARSFMGEAPTGKKVELNGLAIYQIAGGRIVTDWVVPDNLQFLMQLGALPAFGMTQKTNSTDGH